MVRDRLVQQEGDHRVRMANKVHLDPLVLPARQDPKGPLVVQALQDPPVREELSDLLDSLEQQDHQVCKVSQDLVDLMEIRDLRDQLELLVPQVLQGQ